MSDVRLDVESLYNSLPEKQREAIRMWWHYRSHQKIADELDQTVDWSKQTVSRFNKKVEKLLS